MDERDGNEEQEEAEIRVLISISQANRSISTSPLSMTKQMFVLGQAIFGYGISSRGYRTATANKV